MRRSSGFPLGLTFALSALVCLACSSGGDSSGGMMTPGPRTVVVEVRDNSYSPASIQINSGDTVRWVLTGSVTTHTVTALGGLFDSGFVFLQPGDTFDRTFDGVNMTFEYSCVTHQACCAMQGSVRGGARAPDPIPVY